MKGTVSDVATMDGIDISHWQDGIDLDDVDYDFVICKASQGTSYTDANFKAYVKKALAAGKCVGAYHYIGGGDAEGEADHFLDVVGDYVGQVVLALDWEGTQNSAWGDEDYLEKVAKRVISKAGVYPLIYCSKSSYPWDLADDLGCGRWVAQYADNSTVSGYQTSPWNEGSYDCTVRQYSSHGRLSGWSGNLDLDKAYISASAWAKLAGGSASTSSTSTGSSSSTSSAPSGTTAELAAAVMNGEYGNGDARKAALGSRYSEVQALINEVAAATVDELAEMVIAGELGNGDVRKAILGDRYAVVQAIVNKTLGASYDVTALAKAVIAGDYGNGTARKTALGSLYSEVQAKVNELLA